MPLEVLLLARPPATLATGKRTPLLVYNFRVLAQVWGGGRQGTCTSTGTGGEGRKCGQHGSENGQKKGGTVSFCPHWGRLHCTRQPQPRATHVGPIRTAVTFTFSSLLPPPRSHYPSHTNVPLRKKKAESQASHEYRRSFSWTDRKCLRRSLLEEKAESQLPQAATSPLVPADPTPWTTIM